MSKKINCPRCDMRADFAGGEPYCRHCGWRRARVEERLQGAAKFDPRILAFALVASGFLAWLSGWDLQVGAMALGFYCAFFGLATLWAKYELHKLTARPVSSPTRRASVPKDAPPFVAGVRRTVRLRPTWRATLVVVSVIPVFALFAFALAGPGLLLIVASIILLSATWWAVRFVSRQQQLTAAGGVAAALITARWSAGKGRRMIRYEFRGPTGQLIRGETSDPTGSLYEDMTVPVFYNPNNLDDQLLAPLSYFEVVGSENNSQPKGT